MDKLLKLKDRIVAKVFRILTLNIIFPLVYKKAARKPVDENKVVVIEIRLPAISNSFKVIFDELVGKYNFTVHSHFLLVNSVRRNIYLKRCNDMLRDIATAKYVIISDSSNCIGSVKMRPETKLLQLWHGCGAFKKFGFSTADLVFGESKKEQLKHPTNNNDTYVTVSSPEVIWAFEEAMNIPPRDEAPVVATGCSRTDVFYDKDFIKSAHDTFYDLVPQAKGKKVILYAPTFRGRVAKAKTSRMLNIDMFHEAFGDDYVLVFKHHPLVKVRPGIPNEYRDFAFDVTKSMNIEDLLCVSDICITDYSSLVFEYSLFEKPIIFFAYDLDDYFDWRGFYYDYFEMSPGPICTTNREMIDYISNIDTQFDKQKVKDFRYKFMRSCDGHATQRIMDLLFGKDVLEAHKKENGKIDTYDIVPKSDNYFRFYLETIERYKKEQKQFSSEYRKYLTTDIIPGKAVMLNVSGNMRTMFKKYFKDMVILKTGKDSVSDIAKEIATAHYIFIDKDVKLLNMIDIKEDTKVVRLPNYAFPFIKSDRATLKYKSNLYKELEKYAPTTRNCDIVPISDESLGKIYCESYGVDESALLNIGCPKSDLLLNKKFKNNTLKKFYGLHPEAEGKKIILTFTTRFIDGIKKEETDLDGYLYEFLKDDYVFIKLATMPKEDRLTTPMRCYLKSMFDVTGVLSSYEAMAIADVVIGGYENDIFTFPVTGRPLFIYAPDYKANLHLIETNYNYETIVPAPVFDNPKSLVKAIVDIDNYDYTRYNTFKEQILSKCDGKVTQRLLIKLGLINK